MSSLNITHRLFYILPLLTLILFSGCKTSPIQTPKFKQPVHFSQNVMTIDYHISVGDPLDADQVKKVQNIIDETFTEINEIYNKWNPRSEISHINALPAHTPHILSSKLAAFLEKVDTLVELSGGRFDPTVEPLQQLWKSRLELGKQPSDSEIEAIKQSVGWSRLHIENGVLYKKHEQTQLDLGGVAKGYCVDLLIEKLHHHGLNHLFVEWGGEVRSLGLHPSLRPWRVYISLLDNPDPSQAIAEIDLCDRALATSGDYFQYWKIPAKQDDASKRMNEYEMRCDGDNVEENSVKAYCHIFNPLTLSPIEIRPGSVASATLMALDCMTADALAKVLMLFDSAEDAQNWLKELQKEDPNLACWMATRPSEADRK